METWDPVNIAMSLYLKPRRYWLVVSRETCLLLDMAPIGFTSNYMHLTFFVETVHSISRDTLSCLSRRCHPILQGSLCAPLGNLIATWIYADSCLPTVSSTPSCLCGFDKENSQRQRLIPTRSSANTLITCFYTFRPLIRHGLATLNSFATVA